MYFPMNGRKILLCGFWNEFRISDQGVRERGATLAFRETGMDLIASHRTFCALSAFCWSVAMICAPVTDS